MNGCRCALIDFQTGADGRDINALNAAKSSKGK